MIEKTGNEETTSVRGQSIRLPSLRHLVICHLSLYQHMSNRLNLLHPRKDVAEMVIVSCVSPIVPERLVFVDMK